ncbi:MAG TPA: DUF6496 domain-containing protein [Candidatus Binataceae bacterium]|nr:DUF6496 domain-containing protein [Candidatus Binataceae bacterium]
MPKKNPLKRARRDAAEGKAPSTQAGEFVRDEIEHVRQGKHGARSPEQAIAIGLSRARRAGIKLPAPSRGHASSGTARKAREDLRAGKARPGRAKATKRARASKAALQREGRSAASSKALGRHARQVAGRRSREVRAAAARKAARTRAARRRKNS